MVTAIGSVPYLNALPLLEGLHKSSHFPIIFDTPAQLHELVAAGKIQVALLPVASYLENPELKLIPGSGIVSHGAVRSVKVFHERPGIDLSNTTSIFLDPHSKTAQRLLKLILYRKYERKLEEITFTDNAEAAESILYIGDKALLKKPAHAVSDLGLEWHQLTGLPFVYACWMSQRTVPQPLLTQLHNAKMMGKESIPEIASRQQILAPEEAFRYLTENIQYDIEGPELVGLKTFFDWVVELENQNYDTSFRFVA